MSVLLVLVVVFAAGYLTGRCVGTYLYRRDVETGFDGWRRQQDALDPDRWLR